MTKKSFYIFLFLFNLVLVSNAQSITVSNVVTTGRFNTCNIAPTITASLLPGGSGSVVQNGALACINPNDSSLIELVFTNLRWNQIPDNNWLHGVYFINGTGTGIRIIGNSLTSPNWIFKSTGSLGACPTGGQVQGGPGYYFDGTSASSCCPGNMPFDGLPNNNYGDITLNCSTPFSISFILKIRNFNLGTNFFLKLRGSSDGNTGCWNIPDLVNGTVTFTIAGIPCITNPLLCNPVGNTVFTTSLTGPHQWQQSMDSVVFNNITDNTNFVGTNTASLNLNNISSSNYGQQFRCVSNGLISQTFTLTFKNTWTGLINSDWHTAGNWSCNTVPDAFTDVIINAGSNVVLGANTTIRSLRINAGGNLTTNSGVTLTILH
jgi:hypothetical protein